MAIGKLDLVFIDNAELKMALMEKSAKTETDNCRILMIAVRVSALDNMTAQAPRSITVPLNFDSGSMLLYNKVLTL